MSSEPHIVVIGGGITGLVAARSLLRGEGPERPRVTVLEAEKRVGGKIRSVSIAGQTTDVGAEGLLARVPSAVELCRELGLEDELLAPVQTTISVWTRGRLRELPGGILSGLPDGIRPVLRSGILSPAGIARAALDLVLPATPANGDRAVGELVRGRLGHQALERLVDPLLGTIYASDCDHLSMRATAPQLDALAREHRSLIRGLRAARPVTQAGPVFVTLPGGLERIVTRLRDELRDAEIRCGSSVTLVTHAENGRYRVEVPGSEPLLADGVIVAAPAYEASRILRELSPGAASELHGIGYASIGVITLVYPADAAALPLRGSGFLVPQTEGRLLDACTLSSVKWPHFAGTGEVLVRCAVGRTDAASVLALEDHTLVARVAGELREAIGLRGPPIASRVTRWERALPRYEPGHIDRVARIEDELPGLPGVALAGSAYRGIGVPQCITQGKSAAERVLAAIGPPADSRRSLRLSGDVRALEDRRDRRSHS